MAIDGVFNGVIGKVARPTESWRCGGGFDNCCDSVYTVCFLGKNHFQLTYHAIY